MIDELRKLRELTETLTGNGYLRDQTEEWEYALDAIPEPIYIVNLKHKIKFANKALVRLLGKSRGELHDEKCYETIGEHGCGDQSDVDPDDTSTLYTPMFFKELYLDALDGWFNVTKSPIYTQTNKMLGFICVLQNVTEKKRAVDDLIEREATLDTVFNAAPIGLGLVEVKTRKIISVNAFLCDLLGYSRSELLDTSSRIFYPDDKEYDFVGSVKYPQVNKFGVGAVETKFITKDGRLLDIYLRSAKVAGVSNYLVFTATDITEQKKKEAAIKLNEERLESMLRLTSMDEESEEEIIEYALDEAVRLTQSKIGYIHFVSSPTESLDDVNLSLFKWSSDVYKMCDAKKEPNYPLTEAGCWADCVRTKKPVIHNDYETMTVEHGKKGLPEGHIPLTSHMSVPVLDGNKIVAVAGVGNKLTLYNNTDVKQLTLFMNGMWDIVKRKKAEAALEASKTKYKFILDNSIDTIWTLDTELKFSFVSPGLKEMAGYEPEDWLGTSISEHCPDDEWAKLEIEIANALEDPDFKELKFQINMLTAWDTEVLVEIISKIVHDADGNWVGFQGNTRLVNRDEDSHTRGRRL